MPLPLFVSYARWPGSQTLQARLVDTFGQLVWRCTHRHRDGWVASECAQREYLARSKARAS